MNRTWLNALFCSMMFQFAMVLTVISPLLLMISKTYILTMAQSGWVFTMSFLGFVLFAFFGGTVADTIGKKRLITISLAGLSLSLALVMFASTYIFFCILMFFIGGFGGIVESTMTGAVPEVNVKNSGFFQNIIQVFFGIGALVGPVAAGLLVSSGVDWKICFLLLGAVALIIMVALSATTYPKIAVIAKFKAADFTELLRDRTFVLICLCMFLYTGSEVGSWGWMSTFLKQNLGFALAKSSLAVGIFWVAMTIGRFICGELTLRFSIRRIVIVLAYASFAVTLSSLFITSELFSWVQIILMGFSFSSIWPLVVGFGGEHRNTSSGIVFSVLVGSGGIGAMVIPNLMGLVGSLSNAKLPMLIPSIALLIVGVFFSVTKR